MPDHPWVRAEPWEASELEDYHNAKNDEERRRMLLLFGIDAAHRQDAQRLFAPPESASLGDEKSGESNSAQDTECNVNRSQAGAKRSKASVNRKQNRIDGIIAGIVSGLIAGLILYYWPSITAFVSELFQRLSG